MSIKKERRYWSLDVALDEEFQVSQVSPERTAALSVSFAVLPQPGSRCGGMNE